MTPFACCPQAGLTLVHPHPVTKIFKCMSSCKRCDSSPRHNGPRSQGANLSIVTPVSWPREGQTLTCKNGCDVRLPLCHVA